jgi:hypothetical protein
LTYVLVAFAAVPSFVSAATVDLQGFATVSRGDDALVSEPFTRTDAVTETATSASISGRVAGFLPRKVEEGPPPFVNPGWFNEADYFASGNAATGKLRFALNGFLPRRLCRSSSRPLR